MYVSKVSDGHARLTSRQPSCMYVCMYHRTEQQVYCVPVQNEANGGDAGIICPLTSSTVPDNMPLGPLTKSWEVSQDKVNIVKVIGKGAFGQVAKATVENLHNVNGIATVAIKMLKSTFSFFCS